MPAQTIKTSEANVQRAICDLLSAKKIMWFRMNSSAQLLSYTNKAGATKRRVLRGHKPGTADLLAMVNVKLPAERGLAFPVVEPFKQFVKTMTISLTLPVFVEVKAPGKKQSPEQIEFQRAVENYGMTYLLVDNIDTLVDWLKARGL